MGFWRLAAVALAGLTVAGAGWMLVRMAQWARMPRRRDPVPWVELVTMPVPALGLGLAGIAARGQPGNANAAQTVVVYVLPILLAAAGAWSLRVHLWQRAAYGAGQRLLSAARGQAAESFSSFEYYLDATPSVHSDEMWFSRSRLTEVLDKLPDQPRLRRLGNRHESAAVKFDSTRR